ncbi:WecB/TagA/CpsF family glycosyltransferase [Calderihabitans maritimus]|uniref:N-acetylglucosaminyldiphosphoundecaprenol N-acetyl-beta-D-mannosaminyltransferase n=1 Tax=Calderihabitans maritimus TaxID=1246530 RepID=A0A1Z5HWG4_9FIRM|nr:WecB/TagA/CpsF family glycosyltransferase [Calderihabitans maritimus]GAW93854.1 WecB/TagA/CpsF family glycosyl transferase [Calderihabitans maritimus]
MKVNVLGTRVDALDTEQVVQEIARFIAEGNPHQVVTLNAEILYRAQRDQALKELINTADLVTPDGAGVVWAARRLKQPVPERVTGIDLMYRLVKEAERTGWRLFLFGAAPGVAEEAARNLKKNYPKLQIAGTFHGYPASNEEEALLSKIRQARPHILFVALGAPRQEYWIRRHMQELNVPVSIGVGGSFDVIAGRKKRAPKWMQRLHLEWLFRLLQEPWRYKRMLVLPRLVFLVLKESIFPKIS